MWYGRRGYMCLCVLFPLTYLCAHASTTSVYAVQHKRCVCDQCLAWFEYNLSAFFSRKFFTLYVTGPERNGKLLSGGWPVYQLGRIATLWGWEEAAMRTISNVLIREKWIIIRARMFEWLSKMSLDSGLAEDGSEYHQHTDTALHSATSRWPTCNPYDTLLLVDDLIPTTLCY